MTRRVEAVFGKRPLEPDPDFEKEFAAFLRKAYSPAELSSIYADYRSGESTLDKLLRRAVFRALVIRLGDGLQLEADVHLKHPETFEIGSAVFIGAQTTLQGRYDGRFVVGDRVWIGPHSYIDCRDLVIEDFVGLGPGAKVLGSTHVGEPLDIPYIQTELEIKPVRIGCGADIGMNALVFPGVTIGKHSVIGAGSVVHKDIPDYAIAVGNPARVIRKRTS